MRTGTSFCFLIVVITLTFPQDTQGQVTGLVTDSNLEPLPLVNIVIKNTKIGTRTDESGRYTLGASADDTLLFTYLGRRSHQIEVREIPSVINVRMRNNNIDLEEVEIKARRLRTQAQLLKEYPRNKNLVKTYWGIIDKDRISGSMRIVDGNWLIDIGPDFLTSLKNFVPAMQVTRGSDGVKVSIFRKPAIFEVDGMMYFNSPPSYPSSEIDRVAVLKRTMPIGPSGAGYIIIVNTKGQTAMDELGVDRSIENKILLDNMIIEASTYEDYIPFTSVYLKPLKGIRKRKKAVAIHEAQKQKEFDNPYYYLEIYNFWLSRWKNSPEASVLCKDIVDFFPNNVEALKALAYLEEQYGNYKSALSIYLKILAKIPDRAQSHRDVANAFVESGDYNNALIRYNLLMTSAKDVQGSDLLLTTELMNILKQKGAELSENIDLNEVTDVYTGPRLVFDWNNPKAKFDLRFITSEGYYDTWNNYSENGDPKGSNSKQKYDCKQFFIDHEIKGTWSINLNYHGNQSDYPTYLKLSIYHDYGLPSQSLRIRVYRLSEEYKQIKLIQLIQK